MQGHRQNPHITITQRKNSYDVAPLMAGDRLTIHQSSIIFTILIRPWIAHIYKVRQKLSPIILHIWHLNFSQFCCINFINKTRGGASVHNTILRRGQGHILISWRNLLLTPLKTYLTYNETSLSGRVEEVQLLVDETAPR